MHVTVVGAGIIGTTTAYRIKRRFPNLDISLVAEKFSPNTTSDIAAGWWEPHLDPDTPPHLINHWAGLTYSFFLDLWRSKHIQEVEDIQQQLREGLSLMSAVEVDSVPDSLNPCWSSLVLSYSTNQNPETLCGLGFQSSENMLSHSFLSFTFESSIVLPVFYSWFKQNGVILKEEKIEDLSSLFSSTDLVVNCTGLGAGPLGADGNLYPISGHVIRAQIPNVKCCLFDSRPETWAYIIPNRDSVILGSIDEIGNWDTEVKESNSTKIMENCSRLCPIPQDVTVLNERVGLRPCRKGGVRLELEHTPAGKVIHNYGHGGSGITLSWGCAEDVVEIIDNLINNSTV